MNTAGFNGSTLNGSAEPYVAPQLVAMDAFGVTISNTLPVAAVLSRIASVAASSAASFPTQNPQRVRNRLTAAASGAALTTSPQMQRIFTVADLLVVPSLTRGIATMTVQAFSDMGLRDALVFVRVAQALDAMTFSDGPLALYERMAAAMDMLRTKDSAIARGELIARAAAAVFTADSAIPPVLAEALDALTATDDAAGRLIAYAAVAEALLLAADVQAGRVLLLVATDATALQATPRAQADMTLRIADGLFVAAELHLFGEIYDAWAVNTESGAATQYTNYSFTSMFSLRGRSYGTSEDGLFRLDGPTDAGVPIMARILTGELDFGTSAIKRMEQAWIAYTGSGDMVLKVTVTHQGKREEHWYRSKSVGTQRTEAKMNIGRGLESHYWQFELVNAGGADFELDNLQFEALALSRRV